MTGGGKANNRDTTVLQRPAGGHLGTAWASGLLIQRHLQNRLDVILCLCHVAPFPTVTAFPCPVCR